jgi:hypothetical protein
LTILEITGRRAALVAALLLSGCLIAACGTSSSTSSTGTASASTGGAAAGGSSSARRTALRTCLKQHGVTLPSRPPGAGSGGRPPGGAPGAGGAPGGGGPGFFGGGAGAGGASGGFAGNPKLRAAFQACGGGSIRRGGRRPQLSRAAVTKYVSCVRQHGYNLPNPDFTGKGGVFPSSIRTNPKFQSASRACQSLLFPNRAGSAGAGSGTTTTGPTS